MRESTRTRVIEAIEALGFKPNRFATALLHGRSSTVGLVTIDLDNSLFVDIARGAQRRAGELDLSLQLAFADDDPTQLDAHMYELTDDRVAGILVAPMADHSASIERSRASGCPVVELNYDSATPFCRVLIDNEAAGYVAARHLIDLGRRHIALVLGRTEWQPVMQRRVGIERAIAESGGTVTPIEILTEGIDVQDGVRVGKDIAQMPAVLRPDAVLAITDALAVGVVNEFLTEGIEVPRDVAVIGTDDDSSALASAVPLTTVEMRGEEMGRIGIELLAAEIADAAESHVHSAVVLQPRILARESTVGRGQRSDHAIPYAGGPR